MLILPSTFFPLLLFSALSQQKRIRVTRSSWRSSDIAAPRRFVYFPVVSVAEIKAEIQKLTPEEKKELHDALETAMTAPGKPATMSDYLGSLRDSVIFHPGWDEDEPLEDWEALRDNDSSA